MKSFKKYKLPVISRVSTSEVTYITINVMNIAVCAI